MLHGKVRVTHELIRPDVSFVCHPVDTEGGHFKTYKLVVAGKEISFRDLVSGGIELPSVVIKPGDTFTKKYLPTDQEDYFVWSENGIRASDLWIEDSLERRYHIRGAKKALREYFRME